MSANGIATGTLPPRFVIRIAWVLHRAIYRFTAGRVGLRPPVPGTSYGTMRLTTIGRRSGQRRSAIVAYLDDGPNLVALAMNGWGAAEPAWWLNLQAKPDTVVDLKTGARPVRARQAEGEERQRLWARWGELSDQYDGWAGLRPGETAVVVFEPRNDRPAHA